MIKLSKRLKSIANFVINSEFLVDCGCDHGKLSIYCVLQNKTNFAYLLDLREEPLNQAKKNVAKYNLENKTKDKISKSSFDDIWYNRTYKEIIV